MTPYSDSFRFDIFIAQCLGGQFFTGYSVDISQNNNCKRCSSSNYKRTVQH